jgi:hypothetical protein
MSETVSAALTVLKTESSKSDRWVNSKFEWTKALNNTEAGKVGERLAMSLLGGALMPRTVTYDLVTDAGHSVEVKLCRQRFGSNTQWSWKQIRRSAYFTHLCLIAIEPNRARMFVIPRSRIPETAYSNMHGTQGTQAVCQIAVTTFPSWMTRYEYAPSVARAKATGKRALRIRKKR